MKYLIIMLLLVGGVFADHDEHHEGRHINKELSHLDLSKEQNAKIKKILKEFRFDLKDFREFKEKIDEKRKEVFAKEVFDIKEMDKLNRDLDAASHEIENRFLNSIHTILTKKQRREFIYYFDDWKVD